MLLAGYVFVHFVGAIRSVVTTFPTVLDGITDGSPFGYGLFPRILALVTWTVATSVVGYRAVSAD